MLKNINTAKIKWPEEILGHTHICWGRLAHEANAEESSVCTRNNSICPAKRWRKGGPVRLIIHAQPHWKRGVDIGISLTQVQSALIPLMLLFPWTIFCYLTILSVTIFLLGSRGRNAVSHMDSQCIKTNLVSSAVKNAWQVGPSELTIISLLSVYIVTWCSNGMWAPYSWVFKIFLSEDFRTTTKELVVGPVFCWKNALRRVIYQPFRLGGSDDNMGSDV